MLREYKIREGHVLEFRDGVEAREVDVQHQGYLAWLAGGNAPEVLPPLPAPVPPSLADLKVQAVVQVKSVTASLAEYFWPRLKAEAVRLAVPPFDANMQAVYAAFVQETSLAQFEAVSAIEACATQEELASLLDDLRGMYGGEISG